MTLDPVQRDLAKTLYQRGYSLGAIAEGLDCEVTDLSPWLYADDAKGVLTRAERWPRVPHRDRTSDVEDAWGDIGVCADFIDWPFPEPSAIYDWDEAHSDLYFDKKISSPDPDQRYYFDPSQMVMAEA